MGTVCVETGRTPTHRRQHPAEAGPPPARRIDHPCDFLTCIFHGLAVVHGTTQELCRSTATVWFLNHRPLLDSYAFKGPRGLKQKRKLSPGPAASGHKPDPVTRAHHTYGLQSTPRRRHPQAGPNTGHGIITVFPFATVSYVLLFNMLDSNSFLVLYNLAQGWGS